MTKKLSEIFKLTSQENGFLGIEDEYLKSIDDAKAVVVPFGLEKSVSYGGGTKNGPKAIIKSSHQVELFDEEFWCEPVKQYGVATIKEQKIDNSSVEKALEVLEETTAKILELKKFPLIIGGEHSITAGSLLTCCQTSL